MAPPPPSQAGKFKPRKPAKKIRVGAATGSDAAASHQQQAKAAAAASSSAGRGGSSRGGGGRGGRGGRGSGRGRGRIPAPQGAAFFTAAAPDTVTSSSRGGSAAAAGGGGGARKPGVGSSISKPSATAKQQKGKATGKKDSSQEEIVGVLEEGIGLARPDAVGSGGGRGRAESSAADDCDDASDRYGGTKGLLKTKSGAQVEGYYYDSDSSSEEEEGGGPAAGTAAASGRHRNQQLPQRKQVNLQPVELPFPSTKKIQPPATAAEGQQQPSNVFSVSVSDGEATGTEKSALLEQPSDGNNDWFLVQLPTRLPPLVQKKKATDDADQQQQEGSSSASAPAADHVQVNISPLQADRFDNSLAESIPGRIGKLVVYKSGRTVLLLEGPGGSPTIRMNVTEHGCAFKQQAVVIDKDEKQLVTLGDVQNAIVATPDLASVGDFSSRS